MKKIHIIVSGTVTGVGFRWWLKKKANERSIYGWVKNKTEYEVEAVLIGHQKNINDIIKLCKNGPTLSNVQNIKIEDYNQEYSKKSFDILLK